MSSIGIGVIGACAIATNARLLNIEKMPGLILKAIVGVDLGRTSNVASTFRATSFMIDRQNVLRMKAIHAVVMCTPNYLRPKMMIDDLKAGNHVLWEKPMATKSADANRMTKWSQRQKRILMVGFTHRYAGFYGSIENAINQGVLGRMIQREREVRP